MKKRIALLLAVLMLLTLAACGEKPEPTEAPTVVTDAPTDPSLEPTDPTVPSVPEPVIPEITYPTPAFSPESCSQIIGTWKTPVKLDGSLMNMPEFDGGAAFDVIFTFQESGLYTINADQNAVLSAIREYERLLTTYMMDGFYSSFAAEKKLQGMSADEIEEAWDAGEREAAQTKVDAFITGVALTTRFAAIITHGDYYVQNDMLFLSNGNRTYEAYSFLVRNGLLYFTGGSNEVKYENLWLKFPLPLWPESADYEQMQPEDLAPTLPTYPTVTTPSLVDPSDPSGVTDPVPTIPPGFIPIPTLPGSIWPFPTNPVTEPTTEPTVIPTEPTVAPTDPTVVPTDPTDVPTDPTVKPTETPTDPTEEATKPTAKPTVKPTKPTEAPTDPTEEATKPTVKPTKPTKPTEAPTDPTEEATKPTAKPTVKPTKPTEAPTDPTEEATKPTTKPTVKPTKPTEAPTSEPTEAPTEEAPTVPTWVTDPDDGPIDWDAFKDQF